MVPTSFQYPLNCHANSRFAVIEHRRDDVLSKVVVGIWILHIRDQHLSQQLPVEDVDAHRSEVALWLRRFLLKFDDAVFLIGIHDTEAAGLLHRYRQDGDRRIRIAGDMVRKHLGIIHLVNMVTGENQYILRIMGVDKIDVLRDRICRTAVDIKCRAIFFTRREHIDTAVAGIQSPALSGSRIRVQDDRLILRQHTDNIDVRIGTVAQRKIDDSIFTAEINCRLGVFLGQVQQTCPTTSGKDHCQHLVLFHIKPPLGSLYIKYTTIW